MAQCKTYFSIWNCLDMDHECDKQLDILLANAMLNCNMWPKVKFCARRMKQVSKLIISEWLQSLWLHVHMYICFHLIQAIQIYKWLIDWLITTKYLCIYSNKEYYTYVPGRVLHEVNTCTVKVVHQGFKNLWTLIWPLFDLLLSDLYHILNAVLRTSVIKSSFCSS